MRISDWSSDVCSSDLEEIKSYFEAIPDLIEGYVWEVSLAFMFTRVEKAMNRMLYCGVVKLHRANSTTASVMVNKHHMTRREFKRLFSKVFGTAVLKELNEILAEAEKVRHKVVLGTALNAAEMRHATVGLIEYTPGQ